MARVSVVANGQDNYVAILSLFGGSPLDSRIATQLAAYDRVMNLQIQDQSRLFSILGGAYPFQAAIDLETQELSADKEAVAERINLAFYMATGYEATSIAVVSAGDPKPIAPAAGITDSVSQLVANLAKALNTTVKTAEWVIIALGIGLAAVIYWIAVKPTRAKSLV